jgi:putative ABC transport system ATP-binding protein
VSAALRLAGVRRRRGDFELGPLDLTVARGRWLAVEGRSGSGKSTLLGLLGALDKPDAGRLELFAEDVAGLPDGALAALRRGRIGHVTQVFAFAPHLPVWQSVAARLVPRGVGRGERRARALRELQQLDAAHVLDRLPGALSGGEAQRAALARALLDAPELLVADEPTSNVDEQTAQRVLAVLDALRARGCTIVTATHDALVVARSDERIRLEAGRIVP